ncbi:transposase [Clostridiales bacterium NSJ-32]|uniref:Transposase n=1 Tax=Bianquea renquensis TaxID=2763661 RepID=A0A926DSW6_9FIRM|nr:transposase [Bianquea renquensis]
MHPLDFLCNDRNIRHKRIRPKTPWHNGKVERSHRNDQERFYTHLSFYSYEDLQKQIKQYLKRSNQIPMSVLGWKTPLQKRQGWRPPGFADGGRHRPKSAKPILIIDK